MGIDTFSLENIRKPAYTGKNRCSPCTIINVLTAVIIGGIVAKKSRRAGQLFFIAALVLIYFRGYLIPGTPTFTKRYLPAEILRLFGKESTVPTRSGLRGSEFSSKSDANSQETAIGENTNTIVEGANVNEVLLELGIIEPCEDQKDVCLSDTFAQTWSRELESLETLSSSVVLDAFNLPERDISIVNQDTGCRVETEDTLVGTWPSKTALAVDVSAIRALEESHPEWHDLDVSRQSELLSGIRLFVPECPQTGGPVSVDEGTIETCCQEYSVIKLVCESNGEVISEHPIDN